MELPQFPKDWPAYNVSFAPDSKSLIAGLHDGSLWLYDVTTGKAVGRLEGPGTYCYGIVFSRDGRVAAGKLEQTICVWDMATGKRLHDFEGHTWRIEGMAYSPDGTLLATGGGRQLCIWDVAARKTRFRLYGHEYRIRCVAFSPDGKVVAAGDGSGVGNATAHIHLWNAATGQLLHKIAAHDHGSVTSLAFAADGKTLASTGCNDPLRLWDVATGTKLWECNLPARPLPVRPPPAPLPPGPPPRASALCAAFAPDGKTLAWVEGRMLHLDDAATHQTVRKIDTGAALNGPLDGTIECLAFATDGKSLAGSNTRGKIVIWEVSTGSVLHTFREEREWRQGMSLAFSPDGRLLAKARSDGVQLYEIAAGMTRRWLKGHLGPVQSVQFSPDGRTLASGGWDTTVLLWDIYGPVPAGEMGVPPTKDLEKQWDLMADDDAIRGLAAIRSFLAEPERSVPFLRQLLLGDGPDAARVNRLIADLNADAFPVREAAMRELDQMKDRALPGLRKALASHPPLEVRHRVQRLLAARAATTTAEVPRLRSLRVIEVLEHIGAPEARQLLQALAKEAEDVELAREAKAALARLAKRNSF